MFCDVVDSTVLAQQMDPEDWREVIEACLEAAADVVRGWGGYVARSLGDGLLVYFGWPSAREHDAERAIRAGLAVIDSVRALPPLADAGSAQLRVRIGIHTGAIVVDDAGEVFGDHAHIAARVQTAGEPDSVFVSAATLRLAAGLFVVEDRGLQSLKGVREPQHLYRVVQPSGVRSRLDLAGARLTPYVGRRPELAALLRGWERATDGEGQNVLILAEAGIGKSRLVYELRERLGGHPHTWLECGGTPYTAATPFHPVIALLGQGLGFAAGDTASDKLAKIRTGLGALASETTTALLESFLGLRPPLEISPQVQRQRTLELLAEWNLAMSMVQPLVLLVEDLHWCDPSTLDLLGRLIAQRRRARVLLLATARPEFVPPWRPGEDLAVLALARLTPEEGRDMIAALVDGALEAAVVSTLVERADGVPLYVEELTRSALEPGDAQSLEAVPASLADSLMSRLDRLSGAKQVAQYAAVLGREFAYPLLRATAGIPDAELRRALAQLVDAQTVYERGDVAEPSYLFKHALMQEVAYASLLRRTRQQIHARVARALEEQFSDRAASEPEVIARHYELAGMSAEAGALYLAAGQLATGRSANEEAIAHLRRGLTMTSALPASRERDQQELRLQMALMSPLSSVRSWSDPEYSATVTRARELCLVIGDSPEIPLVLAGIASVTFLNESMDLGIEIATEALTAARRTNDTYDLLSAHLVTGIPQMGRGDLRAALGSFRKVMELYDPPIHGRYAYVDGVDRGAMGYSQAGMCAMFLGHLDRALAWAQQGLALARELNHPLTIAQALQIVGVAHAFRGESRQAYAYGVETGVLSEKFGLTLYVHYSQMLRGAALSLTPDVHSTVGLLQESLSGLSMLGNKLMGPLALRFLADAQRRAGRYDEGLMTLQLGHALAHGTQQHLDDAEMHRVRAEILLDRDGDHAQGAEELLETAIRIARPQEVRLWELRAALVLASLRKRQGKVAEARATLEPVYGWFTEGLDTPVLTEARELLSTLTKWDESR